MNPTGRPMAMGVQVENVSPAELYQVINAACSQDQFQIQASGKRLKEMLEMFGTFDALQEIAAQRTIPLPIRQQAIIQFKLSALHHWKSRRLLSDEHRVRIRNRCMIFLDEQDESIAEFNKVIVSKIARQDFPNNWPTLFIDLLNTIDTNLHKRYTLMTEDSREVLVLQRSLQLVNSVLKELASVKMLNGVKIMANIVEQIRQVLYGYYSTISSTFSAATSPNDLPPQRLRQDLFLAHLVYKCIVKISVWLWNRIDKLFAEEHKANQAWIAELFQNSAIQVKALTDLRKSMASALAQNSSMKPYLPSIKILTKHLLTFGKFFRRLQQLSHQRFAVLPMCGDLILFYWSQVVEATNGAENLVADSDEAIYPLRFLVQGMVLFKENLAQWSVLRRDGTPNKNSLSQEFVENAVRLLVTRFMPLNPSDLEQWMADPEEWVNEEDKENEQWEFEIRACSERVLVQLSNQFPEFVTPLLQTTFKHIAPQPSVDLAGILQKEALYCAIGRCAIRLKDSLPFNEWLDHTLVSEARDTNPNYPIIKRRIAWLIGKWVFEDCTSPNNPKIWEILVHLLKDRSPGTDTVVRLTSATALRECVDTLGFAPDVFAPFLPVAITELVRLIDEADTSEGKRRVANALVTVLEQTKTLVTPFMAVITESLPKLWTNAGEDWLFKATLLVTVTKLVEAVQGESTALGGITVPLIRESLSPGVMINLDEDGLTLWLSTLRNTLTIASVNGAPALQDLFPRAMYLLATNLDLLGKITSIVESYLLLDAPSLLQNFGNDLFQAFLEALKSEAISINMKDIILALQLLVQVAPSNLWGEPMHTSGLFAHLLTTLIEGESGALLLTEHIYLFSRVVMADRQMFLQLMSATASTLNQKESVLYEGLLDQWWGKFDNMSEPRHRKLTAMGIAALASTGRPEVLRRLSGEIFNIWLDVFGEIKESKLTSAEDPNNLSLVSPTNLRRHWELDEAPSQYYQDSEGTPEYERRKAVYDRDSIRVSQLNTYVAMHLREAETLTGSGAFQSYLKEADPTVLKQIQDELVKP